MHFVEGADSAVVQAGAVEVVQVAKGPALLSEAPTLRSEHASDSKLFLGGTQGQVFGKLVILGLQLRKLVGIHA